jgi:hypothetical protein
MEATPDWAFVDIKKSRTSVRDELWPAKTHADLSEPHSQHSRELDTQIVNR